MEDVNKSKEQNFLNKERAQDFLKIAHQFRLGNLPTETPNEKTKNLSIDANENISKAIDSILGIDRNVFSIIQNKIPELEILRQKINETINSGHRIYLCGCGATGRLSLALETIWRHQHSEDHSLVNKIISFMAGGDVALINSVEKFEDFPEFGERQLMELGFKDGDLLISTTEGGETPFVIGATEAATKISHNKPFFLYCNPDEILISTTERSKRVIENNDIHKINLTVGPMALAGSTRMQATTILMYSVGLSLWFHDSNRESMQSELNLIEEFLKNENFHFIQSYIIKESDAYKKNEYILYESDSYLGISLLTDTTERSPTFSLYPFENQNELVKNPSLSYLYLKNTESNTEAWKSLLLREPRTFHWKEVTAQTSSERLFGFNISQDFPMLRKNYHPFTHKIFKVSFNKKENSLCFEFEELKTHFQLKTLNFLSAHIILKIILNNLSTVIMGRLGRYESNLMTWVRASNNKLIDRSVRYASTLLKNKGVDAEYEKLVEICFEYKDKIPRDQALVLKMVDVYLAQQGKG